MTTTPRGADDGIAALARDLADHLAALATPPPDAAPSDGRPTGSKGHRVSLDGSRSMLENAARFVSPSLPAEASLRQVKALLLRVLRVITRDQTVFNSALLEGVRSALHDVEGALDQVHQRVDGGEALAVERGAALQALVHREVAEVRETAAARTATEVAAVRSELCLTDSALREEGRARNELAREVVGSQARLDALEKDRDARFEALARRLEAIDAEGLRLGQAGGALSGELRQLRLDWTTVRGELREGRAARADAATTAAVTPAAVTPAADDPLRAGLYADFEHAFRGSEEEIRTRQAADVRLFEGAPGPIADLGCGRGEFLELLGPAGLTGIGCDANPVMAARAREKGLAVDRADLFSWLRGQRDGSLGGVTAYQVVEHLSPAALFDLVEIAVVKLAGSSGTESSAGSAAV